MNKNIKKLISKSLITVFLMTTALKSYAGPFYDAFDHLHFLNENGTYATNCWRWIDTNGDNICECYRFDEDGYLNKNYNAVDGKQTNELGQWVVDGVVQKLYKSTGRPVKIEPIFEGQQDEYEIVVSTDSETGKVTTKSVIKERRLVSNNAKDKVEKQEGRNGLGEKTDGPQFLYEGPGDQGYLSKGNIDRSPKFKATRGQIIQTINTEEDEPVYINDASSSFIRRLGRDMRKFEVLASKKYTEKMESVNIWGGETWDDVFCLAGNGAYVKFDLNGYNYMQVEIAHQTHGESTADTDCRVELYINNELVNFYDEFNDDNPEIVEEWFDDEDKNIMLKAVIEGDAPGRKIYFRNGRFRKIKTKDE